MANEKVRLTFDELKDIVTAGIPVDQAQSLAAGGYSAEQILELASSLPKPAVPVGVSNAESDGKSAFSYPEGDKARPKPELKRTVFFCGHREDPAQLTPTEIDAYNSIDRDYTARDGRWTAEIRGTGKSEVLLVNVPCVSIDDRMNLPSITLICRELRNGQAAVDPVSLADRVAQLEAQLKAVGAA